MEKSRRKEDEEKNTNRTSSFHNEVINRAAVFDEKVKALSKGAIEWTVTSEDSL